MARKVTTDDIKQFNELYYKHKSYAEVARITGWSASTVSKYVDKNYTPEEKLNIKRFNLETDWENPDFTIFEGVENLGELCELTEEEREEIMLMWEELPI